MIIDSIDNIETYRGLSSNLDRAIAWLTEAKSRDLPAGPAIVPPPTGAHTRPGNDSHRRSEGDHTGTDEMRAIVQEYDTVPPEGRRYEAHRRFIDIQYIVSGQERMLVAPTFVLKPTVPYDHGDDVVLFDPPAERPDWASDLVVSAGTFVVFFPQDAHMPVLQATASCPVKKIVMKVPVEHS